MAARKPLTPSQQADVKKGQAASRQRRSWEAANPQRLKDIGDLVTEHHNQIAATQRPGGAQLQPIERTGMSKAQIYHTLGWSGGDRHTAGMNQPQLPGTKNPEAVPTPKRWEEHSPAEQADISRRVKARTGHTMESMSHAWGAQLDQAHWRAHLAGAPKPYSRDFYTEGPEVDRLHETARKTGAGFGLVAAVNADTSPNMKFAHTFTSGERKGETVYPNAERAEHVIQHVKGGGKPADYSPDSSTGEAKPLKGLARTGYSANSLKGANRAHAVLNEGRPLAETGGFGPKTGPYNNSWSPDIPGFHVADVHSGGGGAIPNIPHAGADRSSGKSPREQALETKGIHSMIDQAARNAVTARGMGHQDIRRHQASQWGEERIQSGHIAHSTAYPPQHLNPEQFGQQKMF